MNNTLNIASTLDSSWDIWDFLEKKGGLDPKGYDQDFVSDLCVSLGMSPPVKNLGRELKQQNVGVEDFLGHGFLLSGNGD